MVDIGEWVLFQYGKQGSIASHLIFTDDLLLFGGGHEKVDKNYVKLP